MATYYISLAGDDTTGNGSLATPWKTLSKAITSSAAGDTIYCIASGGNLLFTNQTFSTNRTIAGYGGKAVFDGAAANVRWTFNGAGLNTLTFQDLSFQNIASTANANTVFDMVVCQAGAAISFVGCTWANCSSNYNLIGDNAAAVWTVNLTDSLINDFVQGASPNYAAVIGFGGGTAKTINVTGCTFDFRTAGATAIPRIFRSYHPSNVLTLTIKNGIFRNGTGGTLTFREGNTWTVTATYSDFYLVTGSPAGTGNLTSDPLFVDPASGNFRLRPTSPCLGTGVVV